MTLARSPKKFLSILPTLAVCVCSVVARSADAPVRFAIFGLVHDHARGFIPSAKSSGIKPLRVRWAERIPSLEIQLCSGCSESVASESCSMALSSAFVFGWFSSHHG